MEQITLNFDTSEFGGYQSTQEYFKHASLVLKDEQGRTVKQCVQAMELDYSPSQWCQKLNKSNNTCLTLDDADRYTEVYNDVSWIYFLVDKHIIKRHRSREELLQLREQIDRELRNNTVKAVGL